MYLVQVLLLACAALAQAVAADVRHPQQHVLSRRSVKAKPPYFGYRDVMMSTNSEPANMSPAANTPHAVTTPLECFQVAEPILTDQGLTLRGQSQAYAEPQLGTSCSQTLMVHTFANSYGAPFVGNYTPPDCDFDHVVVNFTTLVKGRQYDRTGVMYLGDTEVWRTSTAEPNPSGIRWVWLKDMTPFLSLWKQPQTVIFDLENIVNDQYTGLLNTTLMATFFKSPATNDSSAAGSYPPADQIIPITQRLGSQGKPSQYTTPEMNATNTISDFPRNARRAIFSVDVKGQGDEEFWWSNLPQSATGTFDMTYGTYPGYSPWREVQVTIDGQLAGVVWPFPVIYTGGVVPQLHRPIVGIDTFDLREHEIDITPFLPRLCDGNEHTFAIAIVGLVDDGASNASLSTTTGSSWYVTGKVFVWLDEDAQSVTTGEITQVDRAEPSIQFAQTVTQNATGFNQTLDFALKVARRFSVRASVRTQQGESTATWSQTLDYSNVGRVFDFGNGEVNTFSITGLDEAASGGVDYYATNYSYPLFCNQTQATSPEGNLTLTAELNQGLGLEVSGDAVFPTGLEAFASSATEQFQGSRLQSSQNGTAIYRRAADNGYTTGNGQTDQTFTFSGIAGEAGSGATGTLLYSRTVGAANDSVTADNEQVVGKAAASLE
ncbi:Peptide-n4-(N-acetyl-beta-glucosaminyl)asparagine amidase a [Apiospora phragmitis]|uniref:Peptide-n4-(N-acetyl-beta-glucosaminyl)asparagine amidase a n=1 Tax=Apiospora phragmitis TaxID=2905665 RepID=A0ABR1VFP4_9PEZI